MRRVLIDFAHSRERRKRGGTQHTGLSSDECLDLGERHDAALLALGAALTALASEDPGDANLWR